MTGVQTCALPIFAAGAVGWKLHGPLTDPSFRAEEAVYAAAGVDPPPGEEIKVASPTRAATIATVLSASAPALPAPAALRREPRAALQRLWGQ